MDKVGEACSTHWSDDKFRVYKILVEKSEERPFLKPWRRWEDNIKMDLKGIVYVDVD
jgi:hypothetical protein